MNASPDYQWEGAKREVKVGLLVRNDVVKQWQSAMNTDRGGRFNIKIIPINECTNLYESGYPAFNYIIHDGRDSMHKKLCALISHHPGIVIDHPDHIILLFKRDTMLLPVERLGIDQVGIPNQMFVRDSNDFANLISARILKFPVIMKTMEAGGSPKSHEMLFASTTESLKNHYINRSIEFPFVVQEFVDHGGVLYKVYVAGNQVVCTKRKSFLDFHLWEESGRDMAIPQRIMFNSEEELKDERVMAMELPPDTFVRELAAGLHKELKLNIFNFDLVRKTGTVDGGDQYFIVDINHFPVGMYKLHNCKEFLSSFVNEVLQRKKY